MAMVGWALYATARGEDRARAAESPDPAETPDDILRRRYAKGEIDRTQFERMRSEVGTRSPGEKVR